MLAGGEGSNCVPPHAHHGRCAEMRNNLPLPNSYSCSPCQFHNGCGRSAVGDAHA